jgi:chondroitin-sulfate-ABC endolyase/exolyase
MGKDINGFIHLIAMLGLSVGLSFGFDAGSGFDKGQFKRVEHSFEDAAELKVFKAKNGSTVLSADRFKHGKQSLCWSFRPKGELWLDSPEGIGIIRSKKTGGIKLWIYSEAPQDGELLIEGGTAAGLAAGKIGYRIPMKLNFKGWRAIWVCPEEDAKIKGSKEPLEAIRLVANTRAPSRLYLDRMELIDYIFSAREADMHIGVNQIRNSGPDGTLRIYRVRSAPDPVSVTAAELEALPRIASLLSDWVSGSGASKEPEVLALYRKMIADVPEALAKFDQFKICRHPDGRITGNPVFSVVHGGKPTVKEFFDQSVLPLVFAWRYPGSAEVPNRYHRSPELLNRILLAFDHANDQGFAAGSSMGTCYGVHLGLSGYSLAIFLMRDELDKTGILAREVATSSYYTHFNDLDNPASDSAGYGSADELRTVALFRLITIASMADRTEQVKTMRRYSRWMNGILDVSRGLNPFIKPDGTVYHHANPYWMGYGYPGLEMASRIGFWLRNMPFELNEAVRANLKQALLTGRFVAQKYDLPISINGRWPFWPDGLVAALSGFGYAAALTNEADAELAAAFMRLLDPEHPAVKAKYFDISYTGNTFTSTIGNVEDMMKFRADFENIPAEPTPSGHLALPYAGANFHRRGEKFVYVKGNSRYIWDFEKDSSGQLGRNLSRGAIGVYTSEKGMRAAGFDWKGWDWSRFPGTTTIVLPPEALDPEPTKDASRHFTDQAAVGGMAAGADGVFMMRFHDSNYDKSFLFDQSVFFVDDTVVCLGSGIVNGDREHSTETTIFQHVLADPAAAPTTVGDEVVTALPYASTQLSGVVKLLDSRGVGYFFPDGAKLKVFRREQGFPEGKLGRETGGTNRFEVAVLDHGCAPRNGSYHYAITLDGRFDRLDYRVLAQDKNVHAVEFPGKRLTLIAVFDAGDVGGGKLPVVWTDGPALIAMTVLPDGEVELTAACPDIGAAWLPKAGAKPDSFNPQVRVINQPLSMRLRLNGKYATSPGAGGALKLEPRGDETVVVLQVGDGAAHNTRLRTLK